MRAFLKAFGALTRTEIAWAALVFIAGLVYLFGLGGSHAPTNGDEMVYLHIARMTAESGHWLPLQSELVGTRNTKPPLLIWQAMVASDWGAHWSLWAVRLPSIAYTFATTGLLAFFAHRLAQDPAQKWRTACIAAALYLLFFSTFRYGRVYLTSAPETFWLALPMWWVVWRRISIGNATPTGPAQPSIALGWQAYALFGLAMGLGSAYKSFALLAPAAAAIWCAVLLGEPRWQWKTTLRVTAGVAWSTAVGLALFSLWFVLDPDPAAVWQEFVVAENAGKMSGGQGYWYAAFFGAYPMWTQLLAYPANAGLLFFPVLGFCFIAVRLGLRRANYAQLTPALWVLLTWLVVWLVVFTIPSQRSERYVIPAMPALAIAMALLWDRLVTLWFWLTLLVLAPALVLLARIGWVMGDMGIADAGQVAMTLIAACAGLACATAGFLHKNWAKPATLAGCLAVYACFGSMVAPLSGPQNSYTPTVKSQMQGQRLAVPNGFTGQYERYHFALSGARITPYDAEGRNTGALYPDLPAPQRLDTLLDQFDAVVWLQDDWQATEPTCLPRCTVLGTRWHVKSRHKGGEITLQNLWTPQEWLFRREWLLVRRPP